MKSHRALYFAFLILLCVYTFCYAAPLTVEHVASKLSCFCGTCPHLVVTDCGCSNADQIKADVKRMIDSGMTEDQILDAFVAKHGQTVLAAPPAHGFNLAAWVVPFAGFLFGASALAIYLKRQQKNDDNNPPDNNQSSRGNQKDEFDEYYREQLKKELEQRK